MSSSAAKDFSGKVAIVTGASSGIGASVALELSRRGARVVLVARNEKKLRAVAASCPTQCKTVIADLAKDEDIARVVAETIAAFGQLDVLVNNAGFGVQNSFLEDKAVEVFDQIMRVNLRAVVKMTHLAAPHLIKSKGNIINVSSIAALSPSADYWAYCTSKAALDHFSKCAAAELAPKGVRVNVVNPGPVKTDFVENMGVQSSEEVYEHMKAAVPLNRVSVPQEIADLIVFLAGEKSQAVTGSCWVTDNGYLVGGKKF